MSPRRQQSQTKARKARERKTGKEPPPRRDPNLVIVGWVSDHELALHRFAQRKHRLQPADAHDIVQDTFLKAHRALVKANPRALELADEQDPQQVRSWLIVVLDNAIRSIWRKKSNQFFNSHGDTAAAADIRQTAVDAHIDELETAAFLGEKVSRLSEQQKAIIQLWYSGGRVTFVEIAEQLNITPARARNLWLRGIAALRKGVPEKAKETCEIPTDSAAR